MTKRKIITVLGIILTASYVNADPSTIKYKSELNTNQNATVVNIQWGTQEQVNRVWQEKYNGNVIGFVQYDIPGVLCTINSIKPTDWNDKFAMEVVGHELMHCLGARHDADNKGLGVKDTLKDLTAYEVNNLKEQ